MSELHPAGPAVGNDIIRITGLDRCGSGSAELYRRILVFSLESVAPRKTAAMIVQDMILETGNLLEERYRGISYAGCPQVTGDMVCHLQIYRSELRFYVVFIDQFHNVLVQVIGVFGDLLAGGNIQYTGVVMRQGVAARRTCIDHIISLVNITGEDLCVSPRKFPGSSHIAVSQCGEAAAYLFRHDHLEPQRCKEVPYTSSDIGTVEIKVAAIEKDHLPRTVSSPLPPPAPPEGMNIKTGKGHISGKPEDIHNLFYKPEGGKFINEWREGRREDTQIVIVREEAVREGSEMLFAVGKLFSEYDLRGIDAIGAGNLAPLALAAQSYPFIERRLFITAKSFRIGTGLLRPGKFGIHPEYGAVFNTYCASYAMLKIGFHYKSSSHIFAAATPVAIAVP